MTKSPIHKHLSCLFLCLTLASVNLPLHGCSGNSDDPMMKAAPIVLGAAVALGAVYALVKNGDKNATEPTVPSSSSNSGSSGSSGSSGPSNNALISNACSSACQGQNQSNTCTAACVSQATSCVNNQKRSASMCASEAVANFGSTPGTVKPALVPSDFLGL